MRNRWHRLVLAVVLGAGWLPAQAAHVVIEAESGFVLEAEDASAPRFPASLTKMMTVYMTLRAVVANEIAMTDEVRVSAHAAAQPATELGLVAGQTLTVEEAVRATIVRSANDAAVVLAEAVGGTEAAFAAMMTAEAHRLGMTQTVFRNASGLPHPQLRTSARDMAVLGRALIRLFPEYFHLFDARSIEYGGRTLPSYNGLLTSYDGADGIKTGFTCASGYNVVTTAERDGRRLIGVVIGARNRGARSVEMRKLLDDGFAARENGEARTIADLAPTEAELDAAPPTILSQGDCGPDEPDDAAAPRLAGWGLTFGAFSRRAEATAAIGEARAVLKKIVKGRPAIVETRRGKLRRYAALLVGLDQEDAAKACRLLRQRRSFCKALRPAALQNPKALWR